MILHIVVMRDIVANVFAQPAFTPNLGGAIRAFGDQCRDKSAQNLVGQHPADFELYELGTYDDTNASFKLHEAPKQIAVGANYAA